MFKVAGNHEFGKELRVVVVESLLDLMEDNEKIITLDADLSAASGFKNIKAAYPDRFINVGVAEANMMGVAAGLSSEGFIPFVHTFGPFATRRAFDQIYLSGAYAQNNLNIFGSDPGFAVGANGGTHTTFEDVAMMRTIPNTIVCDAADEVQMRWIIKTFSQKTGINYVRANRKNVRRVYEDGSTFELGKGNVVRTGSDIVVISTGQLVAEALMAAEEFQKTGISVEVIDMFCIKPIDAPLIIQACQDKQAVVTFENHSIIGGLGSAVAEVLAENQVKIPFKRFGVNDQFGQVGSPDFLQHEYRLTAETFQQDLQQFIKQIS